ncbi:hypothetical protein [Maribellus mangrovi]|uniref:hypothetical protein n=1 Tax=Maribellus mangrovi TaxID=3133146 RepID=UPI0030EB393D
MLNKGLHSEGVQSSEFRVQSNETNLTSASGMPRHPVPIAIGIVSGSHARGSKLCAQSYLHPQNKFAYETSLTSIKAMQLKDSSQQLTSTLPSGEIKRGEKKSPLCSNVLINNLIDPTLIDLRYPYTNCYTKCRKANFVVTMVNADRLKKEVPKLRDDNFEAHRYIQTQIEFSNINKKRIDKPLKPNCRSTNIKNTFCDLDEDIIWKKSNLIIHALHTRSTNFSPLKRGSVPDHKRQGEGVAFNTYPIQLTEPY